MDDVRFVVHITLSFFLHQFDAADSQPGLNIEAILGELPCVSRSSVRVMWVW
jgi:hypothetical protein